MKATIAPALSLLALTAAAAQAQQPVLNDRVAKSMPSTYNPPECELKSGHFKVSSGATYLKTGIETDVQENKERVWENGRKVLTEAIQKNGQAENGAAWYYLGRIYLNEGNLAGADSALNRAEKLAPQCAKDIQAYRQNGWAALMRAGNDFEEQKNVDSALAMYRQAAAMNSRSPLSHYFIAKTLNEKGQPDSAAIHYGRAAAAGASSTDTSEVKVRNQSAFNEGAIYLNAKKYPEAVKAFERYVKWMPKDPEAKRGLAAAYRGAGQTDRAQALEQELVASGAGAGGGAAGGAGAQDLMSVGVNLYNDKKYAEAAAAFDQVATAQPNNREALFNLANTYLAMKDGAKLLPTAQKLVAIEPMSETALKLVGEGYKQTGKVDDAVKTAEKVLALPVDVKPGDFTTTGSGASLAATATGRSAQTPTGKAIPPAPVALVVEFLDAKGGVVATSEVPLPALKPDATHEIKAAGQGAGIAAWRYKQK
ncbi:MAG: tetratricopeptide repeat protein [Gemmatimonadales bacterium]|nr:tetratricopeptide repeat protein [Gemmatimonadales bacterium]